MAAERLSMRKLRELLRQRLELKLSVREIARSLGIGVGTVNRYLYRAQAAKLRSWPLPPELDDDAALTALLFADEGKVVAWSSRAGNVEKGRVAVELELKNPGTKPWTLAGAMLRGAKGEELTPLPDATPVSILPGFSSRVMVELEATTQQAQGSYTLTLWDADGRSIILENVTFP